MAVLKTLVFDLDGTLIDSSRGILESLRGAFAACGRKPVRALAADVIGPPLRETLALLAGSADKAVVGPLAEAFKTHYDDQGYRLTEVFPGVEELLRQLAALGYPMLIATNKRLRPTLLILEHLGWAELFGGVYALDAFEPPARDKSAMLGAILSQHRFAPEATLYIGDRDEDGAAAAANAMPFAWAAWGYGGGSLDRHAEMRLQRPADLSRRLGAAT